MSATADRQDRAPYAAALHLNAGQGWVRLGVPGHQDQPANYPSLTALAGPQLLAMDIPMFTEGVDLSPAGEPGPSPCRKPSIWQPMPGALSAPGFSPTAPRRATMRPASRYARSAGTP